MDQRTTFQNYSELLRLLDSLKGTKASLLVDHEGLSRLEAVITKVTPAGQEGKSLLVLDGHTTVHLEQVIAVNGLFRWDYSEC